MQVVQTPSQVAVLLPYLRGETFSLQVYPRGGDEEVMETFLAFLGRVAVVRRSATPPSTNGANTPTSVKLTYMGERFAAKIVKSGTKAATFVEKTGNQYVQGKDQVNAPSFFCCHAETKKLPPRMDFGIAADFFDFDPLFI